MSKESGIAVFSQELGDGVSVYSTAGFGLYGVDVFVEAKNGEQARELIPLKFFNGCYCQYNGSNCTYNIYNSDYDRAFLCALPFYGCKVHGA